MKKEENDEKNLYPVYHCDSIELDKILIEQNIEINDDLYERIIYNKYCIHIIKTKDGVHKSCNRYRKRGKFCLQHVRHKCALCDEQILKKNMYCKKCNPDKKIRSLIKNNFNFCFNVNNVYSFIKDIFYSNNNKYYKLKILNNKLVIIEHKYYSNELYANNFQLVRYFDIKQYIYQIYLKIKELENFNIKFKIKNNIINNNKNLSKNQNYDSLMIFQTLDTKNNIELSEHKLEVIDIPDEVMLDRKRTYKPIQLKKDQTEVIRVNAWYKWINYSNYNIGTTIIAQKKGWDSKTIIIGNFCNICREPTNADNYCKECYKDLSGQSGRIGVSSYSGKYNKCKNCCNLFIYDNISDKYCNKCMLNYCTNCKELEIENKKLKKEISILKKNSIEELQDIMAEYRIEDENHLKQIIMDYNKNIELTQHQFDVFDIKPMMNNNIYTIDKYKTMYRNILYEKHNINKDLYDLIIVLLHFIKVILNLVDSKTLSVNIIIEYLDKIHFENILEYINKNKKINFADSIKIIDFICNIYDKQYFYRFFDSDGIKIGDKYIFKI